MATAETPFEYEAAPVSNMPRTVWPLRVWERTERGWSSRRVTDADKADRAAVEARLNARREGRA